MNEQDYFHESADSLNTLIADAEARASEAREEAEEARKVPGLDGPKEAAEAALRRHEAEGRDLRLIRKRVEATGNAFCERLGLEIALDACYDASSWQVLSEAVAAEYVFGHEVHVRLPLDVQDAYRHAQSSGLFARFELCSAFETDGYENVEMTQHYLFGVAPLETQEALFLVAEWSDAGR